MRYEENVYLDSYCFVLLLVSNEGKRWLTHPAVETAAWVRPATCWKETDTRKHGETSAGRPFWNPNPRKRSVFKRGKKNVLYVFQVSSAAGQKHGSWLENTVMSFPILWDL